MSFFVLRDRTEAGKYRKDHDCPGKHANTTSLVGQYAEKDTANHCGDQCRGNQGGRLRAALRPNPARMAPSMKLRISRSNPSIA
jgi:hypothetical protein